MNVQRLGAYWFMASPVCMHRLLSIHLFVVVVCTTLQCNAFGKARTLFMQRSWPN